MPLRYNTYSTKYLKQTAHFEALHSEPHCCARLRAVVVAQAVHLPQRAFQRAALRRVRRVHVQVDARLPGRQARLGARLGGRTRSRVRVRVRVGAGGGRRRARRPVQQHAAGGVPPQQVVHKGDGHQGSCMQRHEFRRCAIGMYDMKT